MVARVRGEFVRARASARGAVGARERARGGECGSWRFGLGERFFASASRIESLNYIRRACARAVARASRRVVARVRNSSNNSFRIVSGSCGILRVDPAATSTGARLGRIENLYSTAPTTCWIS